jgi:hypothetical protein
LNQIAKEQIMDSKKLLFVIPVVSALVLAVALGVMAYSSSSAAYGVQTQLVQDDDTNEPIPWMGDLGHRRGPGFGDRFGFRGDFDYDAFIADELGVTVEELQAARQAAHAAALEQAVEDGLLTQEQADLILAGNALRRYIDPQEILSQALGIDVADLEAARESGESVRDLIGDMEPEAVKEALQAAYEDAVQQAISAGVITEDQATQLQEKGFKVPFFGMRGEGFHRFGGFPGMKPAPDADGDM